MSVTAAALPTSEMPIPGYFRCPISLELMEDPVTTSTGTTYDRRSIERWLDMGNTTCPATNSELPPDFELIPNHSIRRMIQAWCVLNPSPGVGRIPTPRVPLSSAQAAEAASELVASAASGDRYRCLKLSSKIRGWAMESERSRRRLVSSGAPLSLAIAFCSVATVTDEVLVGILSALAAVISADDDDDGTDWRRKMISSPGCMSSIASIMHSGDLSARTNAVSVVKQLVFVTAEEKLSSAIDVTMIRALVNLLKVPVSPQATKASLVATHRLLISSDDNEKSTAARFVSAGLVPAVVEILSGVDDDRSTCEKALAVLDSVLDFAKGRTEAYGHALVVPVLVKKMLRVSGAATELAVSAMWKLCKKGGGEVAAAERFLEESLHYGGFQKLLLLLQVGYGSEGTTKEKMTELLKMMNSMRVALDCSEDSLGFNGYLKKPN